MTLEQQLQQILDIKQDIKTVLNDKGIETGSDFSTYASKINQIQGGGSSCNGFNLFDIKISDHKLENNEALGWAEQGTKVYKTDYPDFYAKCFQEYNNAQLENKYIGINANKNGTPTDNNGVVSGFSSSNYYITDCIYDKPFNNFEIQIKFTTGSDISTAQILLTGTNGTMLCLPSLNTIFSGKFGYNIGIDSWLADDTGTKKNYGHTIKVQSKTTYLAKMIYDGQQVVAYISTDNGDTWIQDWELETSVEFPAIGFVASKDRPWKGSLDFNECYLKINNELVWSGAKYVDTYTNENEHIFVTQKDYDYVQALFNQNNNVNIYTINTEEEYIILPKTKHLESENKKIYYCVGNTVSNNTSNIQNKLNDNQITNCLLEVPQNIKLELNDGVLTLKAGSKVIVPNGAGVFEEIILDVDKTDTAPISSSAQCMVYLTNNKDLDAIVITTTYSGNTDPGNNSLWYDTTNNNVRRTTTSGVVVDGYSLPIAIVSMSNGVFTSIDQVFNGMGYIGSTIWVDKGVKGLIPNGRNEDGSLNNIKLTTNKVAMFNYAFGMNIVNDDIWLSSNGHIGRLQKEYIFTVNTFGDLSSNTGNNQYRVAYVIEDNLHYVTSDTGASWEQLSKVSIATCNTSLNTITSLQPKQPFRAIDYSDKSDISGWGMPSNKYIDLTLGASSSTYTAPANGYFYLNKTKKSQTQYIALVHANGLMGVWSNGNPQATEGMVYTYLPVKKGDIISIVYSASGAVNRFTFIYAEGDK